MREIYIQEDTRHINIGKEAENDSLIIYFSTEYYTSTYGGGGDFYLLAIRPGESETPYLVDLDLSHEGYVCWIVSNVDVAFEGYGACELHYVIGEMIAKSHTYTTLINPALGEGEGAPSPSEDWLAKLYAKLETVWDVIELAPGMADYAAQAQASAQAAQAAQEVCEEIAVEGGYTRTEMDTMLASKQDALTIDAFPEGGSSNPVQSGGVQIALSAKADASHTHSASDIVSDVVPILHGGTGANSASGALTALGAQPELVFDSAPTSGSSNPVTSGGVYTALQSVQPTITIDTAMSTTSTNPVQNKAIATALANKADTGHTHAASDITSGTIPIARGGTGASTAAAALTALGAQAALTFDSAPTSGSSNPVTSGGVYAAMQNVSPSIVVDTAMSTTSTNPVRNSTITAALANKSDTSHTHSGYAAASHSHAAGDITSGILAIARGGTGNGTGYVRAGLKSGTTAGNCSTAEGYNTSSTGSYSHAEGYNCTAKGLYSHAEGYNTSSNGSYSHAEGYSCTVSGNQSHAEGYSCTASGDGSHAEGYSCTASGGQSHAGGNGSKANGSSAFAFGLCVIAGDNAQAAFGEYNVEHATASGNTTTFLIVGKGTSSSARANCFRVDSTAVYGAGAYNSSGADYAELFEWQDGNPSAEDRAGLFATLDGAKIRLVTSNDDFILGIVSGFPSVVGDVFDDQWQGMYITDVFGRPVWEDVEVPAEYDGDGNEITPAHTETRQKLNPAYDGTIKYKARTERPEWDAVGIMGKLVARDDGTCQINGWAKPGPGAIATHSDTQTKYRVMERLDDSHIRVLIL